MRKKHKGEENKFCPHLDRLQQLMCRIQHRKKIEKFIKAYGKELIYEEKSNR